MTSTLEQIIQELQNRLGNLVGQYETQLAILKVQTKELIEAKDNEIQELKKAASKKESK